MTLVILSIKLMLLLLASPTSASNDLSLRGAVSTDKEKATKNDNHRRLAFDPPLETGCDISTTSEWAGIDSSFDDKFNMPDNQSRGCADNEVAVGFQFRRLTGIMGHRWSSLKLVCDAVTSIEAVKAQVNAVTGDTKVKTHVTVAGEPEPASGGSYGKSNSDDDFVQALCPVGHVLTGINYRNYDVSSLVHAKFIGFKGACEPLSGIGGSVTTTDNYIIENDGIQGITLSIGFAECDNGGWVKSLDGSTAEISTPDGDVQSLVGFRLNCCV